MIQKIINHFSWSDWVSIGEQVDDWRVAKYEVFKKVNKNGISRYKKIKIISAACYTKDLRITNPQ